jgi:uncharacterized protein YxeA
MKTSKSIIAIIVLAIMVTAVAFVSCKKDNENALNQKSYSVQQAVDVRQIEDITSYLKDFKKKMTKARAMKPTILKTPLGTSQALPI